MHFRTPPVGTPPPRPLLAALVGCALAAAASAQIPSSLVGDPPVTELGVPFQLPQLREAPNPGDPERLLNNQQSNALTVSWDGRLVMYVDSGNGANPLWSGLPSGTSQKGFVFATFDRSEVTTSGGVPDFTNCFGTPLPRFAQVASNVDPASHPGNTYPGFSGFPEHYPFIPPNGPGLPGSMGELGLKEVNFLSNNMYPVPGAEQYGHNPWPSNSSGAWQAKGTYLTYDMYVTFQDIPKFWHAAAGRWRGLTRYQTFPPIGNPLIGYTDYQVGTYPNNQVVTNTGAGSGGPELVKRNGRTRMKVVTNPATGEVVSVAVLEKWQPFEVIGDGSWSTVSGGALTVGHSIPSTSTMYADNFEPTLTLDGHLMVGKGSPRLATREGPARVVFYYNQTAFGISGWEGPWDLQFLYDKRNVALGADQRTIGDRYPLARRPIKDYDGTIFGDANGDGVADANSRFEGGYTWLSPDGRFVIYSVKSAGVGGGSGNNHPQSAITDGGGSSNRSQTSIVGSVTGWQMWRIDHAAAPPRPPPPPAPPPPPPPPPHPRPPPDSPPASGTCSRASRACPCATTDGPSSSSSTATACSTSSSTCRPIKSATTASTSR